VQNIDTYYGSIRALFKMSLRVEKGEMVSLMGRNGMGKTTTIRAIMGMTPAASGAIRFAGKDIRKLASYKIARLGIGLVPENRRIFPNLTARENLVAAAKRRDAKKPWTLDAVYDLFPAITERQNNLGNQLSGGEQQMVAIGRALMTNPSLLILDEATEGLAPKVCADIWKSLGRLKNAGLSILIVDKNLKALSCLCDRHYIVEKGRVAWQGTADQFSADPSIGRNYIGVDPAG
jgi:branched-chain amino acid transport system ATP-binding protein